MKTIPEAINCNSPALAQIKKEHGEVPMLATLVLLLGHLVKFFNVGKTFNDFQLAETAKLILQEYYFLKIEDLKLCFDGMKTGKYLSGGQLYDRMDGNIILTALNQYTEERIQQAEIISNEKHKAMQDEYDGEEYFVRLGKNYLLETEKLFEETDRKELATRYNFREAIRRKNHIVTIYDIKDVTITYSNKSEIGLIDYLKANRPDLVPEEKEVKKQNRYPYALMVEEIHKDTTLTEMEKENKIRALSGLLPLTSSDFMVRKKIK